MLRNKLKKGLLPLYFCLGFDFVIGTIVSGVRYMNKELLDRAIVHYHYEWPSEDDNFLRFDHSTGSFFTYRRSDGMAWATSIFVCDRDRFEDRVKELSIPIENEFWFDLESTMPISLPPVGTICEVRPQWEKVRIVAYDENKIVYWNYRVSKYCYFIISDVLVNPFRPIFSEKFIKEAERKRVVDSVFESLDDDRKRDEYSRILIEHLYDAIKQNNFK
jgi:hypothetical protein